MYFDIGIGPSSVQNRQGALFFVALTECFGPCFMTLNVFIREKAIFHQEYYGGAYRVSSYFISKNISELPIQIFVPFVFGAVSYYMIGFQSGADNFFYFNLLIVLTALTSQSLGLVVAAGVKKVEVGSVIIPILLTLFMLFAGFYINAADISVVFVWLKWLSYIQYSYRALMQNEFQGLILDCDDSTPGCFATGDDVLDSLSLDDLDIWSCCIILLGMSMFFRLCAYLFLRFKDLPTLRLETRTPHTERSETE